MGTWVISFAGLATVYAALGCLVFALIARLLGKKPGWQNLLFVFVTLTFVMLTQHPFPAPGTLSCPVPTATPQLIPLRVVSLTIGFANDGATGMQWLQNRLLAATAMNFFICFVIGLCLPAPWAPPLRAALFGAALTSVVELTQLTGVWGIYPCAYRQFNVDDLLMNFAGVCAGAYAARKLRKSRDRRNPATF